MKNAVVLLSGGLDSATVLAIVKRRGFQPHALTVSYGQRHQAELAAASRVASFLGVKEHRCVDVDLRSFGGSALTDTIEVPDHGTVQGELPPTYVPARNTVMLSVAMAYAEVKQADHIFYGANVHDYSGYPDCRPDYVQAFVSMANLATQRGRLGYNLSIEVPLMDMTKAEIIALGTKLGVDYGLTVSCYRQVDDTACGACDSCYYRRKGFVEAGIQDPTKYSR